MAGVADRLGREFCRARRGCDGTAIRSCAETGQREGLSGAVNIRQADLPRSAVPILDGAEDFVRTVRRRNYSTRPRTEVVHARGIPTPDALDYRNRSQRVTAGSSSPGTPYRLNDSSPAIDGTSRPGEGWAGPCGELAEVDVYAFSGNSPGKSGPAGQFLHTNPTRQRGVFKPFPAH